MQTQPDWSLEEEEPSGLQEDSSSLRGRRALSAKAALGRIWNPAPVAPPRIDPDMDDWSWPERTVEVVTFALLSTEFWLSRGGLLREWIRLNIWLALFLGLGAFLVVPPLTALIDGAAEWSRLLTQIVGNFVDAALRLPPVVLGIATVLVGVKVRQRYWRRKPRRRSHYDESYDGYQ